MYQNADVSEVIKNYEKWTGRRVISSVQVSGPIKIEIGDQVPYSEAARIVEMVLLLNGFALTPTEDEKIWKLSGLAATPKQAGIPFIDNEASLPPGEQVVMFLFKLKWADPTELATTISQGIVAPAAGQYTSIIPLVKSNALLVTENTSIIRTLIKVVRAIDVEPSEVISEFIMLQHAQAEDVVTNLEKLFEKTQTQQAGAPTQPRVQRTTTNAQGNPVPAAGGTAIGGSPDGGNISIEIDGGGSGAAIGPTEDNIIIGKVKLTADKRTNRIHVVSRPVNMKLIRGLIEEYDADVKLPDSLVRPLKFRPVSEVIDSVVAAIKDPGEKDDAGGTGTTGGLGQRPGTTQNNNNQQFGNNRFGNTGGAGGLGGGSDAGSLGESLSTSEQPTNPTSQTVGKSTVIADPWSNSIIVVGTPDVKQKVSALLDELDVRQPQVMIQVVIGELRLGDNEQFGLDYILRNGGVITQSGVGAGAGDGTGGDGTGTGGGGTTVAGGVVGYNATGQPVLNLNNLLTQQNITQILTAGSGGLGGFIAASDAFTATLTALESTNRFRVITTPRIFTTNNKRAIITSGEEVPVPTSIQSQFNGTGTNNGLQTNSSIQFKPIELRLEVLPLVNSEREVSLEIVQNISDRAGTTRIDNNDIINVTRRAVKTYVTVPNNGTLVLGGLIKENQDVTKSGINKLVNLPLIGPLFGKTTKDKTRSELIILMRPVVTVSPDESIALREKTFQSFAIPPDLDAAIMPQGMRETIPRAKVIRQAPLLPRTTAPVLRRR